MKKPNLIAISSSPNKGGSSDTLLDSFLEGVKKSKKLVNIKKIYLYDLPCESYQHTCKTPLEKEKEFAQISQDLKEASGVVIATPTYNFGVPGVLKNFIDRIGFIALDYKNFNLFKQPKGQLGHLKPYFIVTGGTPKLIYFWLYLIFPMTWLRVIFLYYGAKYAGGFYSGGLGFRNQAKDNPKLLKKIKAKGNHYAAKYL